MGIPLNEEKRNFSVLDRIIITKSNNAQKVNTRAQSRQLNWTDYTATLLIDDNDSLDLLTKNRKRGYLQI